MDVMKILLHGYDNISELTTEELIALITEILDIEEIGFALTELYTREPAKAKELGRDILEQYLGDRYMQATVVGFFADCDKEYLVDYVNRHLDTMDVYVFRSIVDFLMYEAGQPFEPNIPDSLLQRVFDKYHSYKDYENSRTAESFDYFKKVYKRRLRAARRRSKTE